MVIFHCEKANNTEFRKSQQYQVRKKASGEYEMCAEKHQHTKLYVYEQQRCLDPGKKIVTEEEEMPYKGFFSGIKWTAQELYKVRIKCMHMLKSIR